MSDTSQSVAVHLQVQALSSLLDEVKGWLDEAPTDELEAVEKAIQANAPLIAITEAVAIAASLSEALGAGAGPWIILNKTLPSAAWSNDDGWVQNGTHTRFVEPIGGLPINGVWAKAGEDVAAIRKMCIEDYADSLIDWECRIEAARRHFENLGEYDLRTAFQDAGLDERIWR